MRGALEAETRERGILDGQTESVTSGGFDLSFSLPDVPWDKQHVNFLAHKRDPLAEISWDIVWQDALAPLPQVLLSCFCKPVL